MQLAFPFMAEVFSWVDVRPLGKPEMICIMFYTNLGKAFCMDLALCPGILLCWNRFWLFPLVALRRNHNAKEYNKILDNHMTPTVFMVRFPNTFGHMLYSDLFSESFIILAHRVILKLHVIEPNPSQRLYM